MRKNPPGNYFMSAAPSEINGSFVLPVLEYCSAVWCSAADSHLNPLESCQGAAFLAGGVLLR